MSTRYADGHDARWPACVPCANFGKDSRRGERRTRRPVSSTGQPRLSLAAMNVEKARAHCVPAASAAQPALVPRRCKVRLLTSTRCVTSSTAFRRGKLPSHSQHRAHRPARRLMRDVDKLKRIRASASAHTCGSLAVPCLPSAAGPTQCCTDTVSPAGSLASRYSRWLR
jgi:hypothetical protein